MFRISGNLGLNTLRSKLKSSILTDYFRYLLTSILCLIHQYKMGSYGTKYKLQLWLC